MRNRALDKSADGKVIFAIMQILLDIGKLKTRARKAGIPLKDICARAGVNVSSVSKLARVPGSGRVRTLVNLNMALFQLERERSAYLAGLPPVLEEHAA
jgi:hypothetical protein